MKNEITRKSIHISSILLPISYKYIFGYDKRITLLLFVTIAIISIVIELLRLENKNFRKYFHLFFGVILRKHELHDFTGASYLLTSAIVCVAFFPPEIAFVSMAFLSIGDSLAALIGIKFGKRKFYNSDKTLEGSLACFVSTFIFGLFVFKDMPFLAFLGAFSVTLAEATSFKIDDNVKIPIISGIVMSLATIFVS